MKLRWLWVGVIVAASVGWLAPLWLGVETTLTYLNIEVEPRLSGETPGNSFPFISFARDCLKLAFVWLALVVLAWSSAGAMHMTRSRAVRQS